MSNELVKKVTEVLDCFGEFRDRQDATLGKISKRLDSIEERVETREALADRPKALASRPTETWIDRKTGVAVPALSHEQKVATLSPNPSGVSLGRWLRGITLGSKASDHRELADELKSLATSPDASGGYAVPAPLAGEFIDNLRAHMVLSKAGARTVPMTSKTLQIAKLTGDPTVSWHIQNAAINASDPTLAAATLNAHTVVGVSKFSLELAQDSANIEDILTRSLTQAVAVAIDQAGLTGAGTETSPVANSPTGVAAFSGRNSVTSVGAPTNWDFVANGIRELLVDGVPLERIGALIYHPLLWSKMAKLKTGISSDQTALALPPHMQGRQQLVTTACGATGSPVRTTAFIADWTDLLFGVRTDITIRILDQAYMGSNLQLAMLVYARVDFQPARAASFCSLEGITVNAG